MASSRAGSPSPSSSSSALPRPPLCHRALAYIIFARTTSPPTSSECQQRRSATIDDRRWRVWRMRRRRMGTSDRPCGGAGRRARTRRARACNRVRTDTAVRTVPTASRASSPATSERPSPSSPPPPAGTAFVDDDGRGVHPPRADVDGRGGRRRRRSSPCGTSSTIVCSCPRRR